MLVCLMFWFAGLFMLIIWLFFVYDVGCLVGLWLFGSDLWCFVFGLVLYLFVIVLL